MTYIVNTPVILTLLTEIRNIYINMNRKYKINATEEIKFLGNFTRNLSQFQRK